MYQEEYKRWMTADLEDADLMPELAKIEGNDDEIKERFAVSLKFGTAGLRGVLGAGMGLPNMQKNCDKLTIESKVNEGTKVTMTTFFLIATGD